MCICASSADLKTIKALGIKQRGKERYFEYGNIHKRSLYYNHQPCICVDGLFKI